MTSVGVIMDPIQSIKVYKDSTFAMLLAAQSRGWALYYMEVGDLSLHNSVTYGRMRPLKVWDNNDHWFELGDSVAQPLSELDVVLMRKDPPIDALYIHCTQLLDFAVQQGVLVVNRPQSLRDANEKLFAIQFGQCIPETLVTCQSHEIKDFLQQHQDIILKPLDAMGGQSIFRVKHGDTNTNVIIETMTANGRHLIMAQRFIPEISAGDKRILIVDGEVVPFALARVPAKGENRGNIAAGGTGVGVALSARDYWICEQVATSLRDKGLMFVGLDVIGDYLTEINVTSPTCIRELDKLYGLDIAGQLMDAIAKKLPN